MRLKSVATCDIFVPVLCEYYIANERKIALPHLTLSPYQQSQIGQQQQVKNQTENWFYFFAIRFYISFRFHRPRPNRKFIFQYFLIMALLGRHAWRHTHIPPPTTHAYEAPYEYKSKQYANIEKELCSQHLLRLR